MWRGILRWELQGDYEEEFILEIKWNDRQTLQVGFRKNTEENGYSVCSGMGS